MMLPQPMQRIPEPRLTPPDPALIGRYARCKEPVYQGDPHYKVGDETIVDSACFEAWAADELGAQYYGFYW